MQSVINPYQNSTFTNTLTFGKSDLNARSNFLDELKGAGNSYDFGARMYDPRVGRWFKPDPMEPSLPSSSTYSFAENSPIFYIDKGGKTAYAYFDAERGVVVIQAKIVLYTGDQKVFNSISTGDIEAELKFQFENCVIKNEDGTYSEHPSSVSIGGVSYPVELDVEVVKVYNKGFNEEIEKSADFDKYNDIFSDEGQPVNINDPSVNYIRVENSTNFPDASHFAVGGNQGMARSNQIIENGKVTTTIPHEFFFHGLLGLINHWETAPGEVLEEGEYGDFLPLGIASNAKYATGGEINPMDRRLYQFELDYLGVYLTEHGFTDQKNGSMVGNDNMLQVGFITSDPNVETMKQSFNDKNGKDRSRYSDKE